MSKPERNVCIFPIVWARPENLNSKTKQVILAYFQYI